MMRRLIAPFVAACVASSAAAGNWSLDMASLTVLPGWQREDGARVAALHIQLAEGWKTYWRAPGDAGIPPMFDLQGSRNLVALTPAWPTPQVFSQNGMRSVGYHGDLVLPVVLAPKHAGQPMTLKGRLMIGVCKDVCVPAELSFDVRIDGNGGRDARIVTALADQPMAARAAGLGQIHCDLRPTDDGLALRAEIQLPATGGAEYAVVETGNPLIWVAEAATIRQGRVLRVETEMMHVEGDPIGLDRSDLRITVLGQNRAVDIQGCPAG